MYFEGTFGIENRSDDSNSMTFNPTSVFKNTRSKVTQKSTSKSQKNTSFNEQKTVSKKNLNMKTKLNKTINNN